MAKNKYKGNLKPKPLFIERMQDLLGDKEVSNYLKTLKTRPPITIRCNTLKISPGELKTRLENKGWKIKQPFKKNPEIMVIETKLKPGELGRSLEHMVGYYYVQELSSMLPVIALKPKPEEIILDLCASPGSKTTQISAKMENSGTLIANEINLGRIKILASNTERCGTTNVLLTKKEGSTLCTKLFQKNFRFDKIIVDAPCSGEGTLRSTPKTYKMWNINTIKRLSKIQKRLIENAFRVLKTGGEMIYSTCTHAPEENEEVLNYLIEKFKDKVKIEKINLPINSRKGILKWNNEKYSEDIKYSCRIYPQDNDTEGFFIAKIRRIK